jgi:hypothetical protein
VCADRDCAKTILRFRPEGTSATPPSDLPVGDLFWRLRSIGNRTGQPQTSAAWRFRVKPGPGGSSDPTTAPDLDVNGDGFADLAVAISPSDLTSRRVAVYLGGPNGLQTDAASTLSAPGSSRRSGFGASFDAAGDLNGDGYGDLLVADPTAGESPMRCRAGTNTMDGTGRVYVYFGSRTGLVSTPGATITGSRVGAHLGASISGGWDIDRDGYADVLVHSTGGPGISSCGLGAGVAGPPVREKLGVHSGGRGHPDISLKSGIDPRALPDSDGRFRIQSAAAVGDVNGDGYADLLLAGEIPDLSPRSPTKLWLCLGTAQGTPPDEILLLKGELAAHSRPLAVGADVNGDGRSDLIVVPRQLKGPLLVYSRLNEAPRTLTPTQTVPAPTTASGRLVATHDLNGDGFADLVIASPYAEKAYIHFGSPAGLARKPLVIGPTGKPLRFATSLSVGDFDGDGYGDLALGASELSAGERVLVYRGGSNGPSGRPSQVLAPRLPEQVKE